LSGVARYTTQRGQVVLGAVLSLVKHVVGVICFKPDRRRVDLVQCVVPAVVLIASIAEILVATILKKTILMGM
jgi:hypothetical protein